MLQVEAENRRIEASSLKARSVVFACVERQKRKKDKGSRERRSTRSVIRDGSQGGDSGAFTIILLMRNMRMDPPCPGLAFKARAVFPDQALLFRFDPFLFVKRRARFILLSVYPVEFVILPPY